MRRCRAAPITKHNSTSAATSINFVSSAHGCNQAKTALATKPGRTSSREKPMTRRSNADRRAGCREPCEAVAIRKLKPIPLHPPIQSTAAQTERFRGLTHVALEALQCFANQNAFNLLQAQFFKVLGL